MDVTQLIPLLIQVPLVGAFMWFVLELNKRQNDGLEKRDRDWREFLVEERAHRGEDTARVADEIKELVKNTIATNTLITQHDSRERIELERRYPRS